MRPHREAELIAVKNRLAGPDAVEATGPPLDKEPLPWFPEIQSTWAISIRPQRWLGMQARMGPWAPHVHHFAGTNGHVINANQWMREGKAAYGCVLNRGQLGCYDSHVRIWETMVRLRTDMALILEDDANIRHTRAMYQQIRQGLDEAKRLNLPWQLFYLGRSRTDIHLKHSPTLVKPKGCCGLFAYILTLSGAETLLKHARPYRLPVDVLVCNLHDSGRLNAIALEPKLCYVVPVRSDTRHIA